MSQNFRKSLKKYLEDRVDEVGNKFIIKNKKYKELMHISVKLDTDSGLNWTGIPVQSGQ